MVMDMRKKIQALKANKKATADDWELLAYEIRVRTQALKKNKMKTISNIIFLISIILFLQINYSNSLRNYSKEPKQIFNEDIVNTKDGNGLWSYAKKGGDGDNWQLEAMRQNREDEMLAKAKKTTKSITDGDWYLMVMDMRKKIQALKANK